MPHSTTSASSANVCITRDADPSGLMLKSFSPSREKKKKNKCQMKGTPYLFSLFFLRALTNRSPRGEDFASGQLEFALASEMLHSE